MSEIRFPVTSVPFRHKNPRGKLTHPSQGQELESAGRFTDQTKNSISSKKCEKVLYVTVIYTTLDSVMNGLINQLFTSNSLVAQLAEHKTKNLKRDCWPGFKPRGFAKYCLNFHKMNRCHTLS